MGDLFIEHEDYERAFREYEEREKAQAVIEYMLDFPTETQSVREVYLN